MRAYGIRECTEREHPLSAAVVGPVRRRATGRMLDSERKRRRRVRSPHAHSATSLAASAGRGVSCFGFAPGLVVRSICGGGVNCSTSLVYTHS